MNQQNRLGIKSPNQACSALRHKKTHNMAMVWMINDNMVATRTMSGFSSGKVRLSTIVNNAASK